MVLIASLAVAPYYQTEIDPNHDREGDIRRLFSTTHASAAHRILRRYRVDYVMESAELPLRFPKDALTTAFESGRFRIHRTSARP